MSYMRLSILCGLLVGMCASVLAQPVLTRDLIYQRGETFTVIDANVENVQPGPGGANQTWDLSAATRGTASNDFTLTWIDPSEAPGSSMFPDANLAEKQTTEQGDNYLFYQDTGSELLLIGLDTLAGTGTYDNVATQFVYPTSFNGSWNDTWSGQLQLQNEAFGTVIADRSGEQTVTYDGYGTIITPAGTYQNVVRLRSTLYVRDAFSVSGIDVISEVTTENWVWLEPNTAYPVFNYSEGNTKVTAGGAVVSDLDVKVGSYIEVEGSGGNNGGGNNGGGNATGGDDSRYGAHVTVLGGSFETSLLLTNTEDTAQTVDIYPITSSGDALTALPIAMAANSAQRIDQADIFTADVSHFQVGGSDDVKVSVGYRAASGGADAPVHEGPPISGNFYLYPGEPDLLFDGVALVNAGEGPATIRATWLNENGNTNKSELIVEGLNVGAKQLTLFDQLFPELDGTGIIRIETNQPLATMVLRGSRDGAFLYQNLPVMANDGQRWIPHLTNIGGNFTTDVFVHNSSASQETALILPFDANGTPLAQASIDVPGNSFVRMAQSQLAPAGWSHFQINADSAVTVSVGYRAAVAGASTAQVNETIPINGSFYLYPGDWNLVYDAVAIVNTGDAAANVTATLIEGNGPKGDPVSLVNGLAPNAKSLLVLGQVFNGEGANAIRIDTNQPIALLVLRGSLDGRYLYLNTPITP